MSSSVSGLGPVNSFRNLNPYIQQSRLARGSHREAEQESRSQLEARQSTRLTLRARGLTESSATRAALKVRAKTEVSQSEDGSLSTSFSSQLKFKYDFIADDGTRISIRARANIQYTQNSDESGSEQSLRIRTKTSVSLLQQNVEAGADELGSIPGLSEEARSAIGKALELFQGVTEAATSQFLSSEPLDGDALINGVVSAFNDFASSALQPFLEQPAGTQTTELPAIDAPAPDPTPAESTPPEAEPTTPVTNTDPVPQNPSSSEPIAESDDVPVTTDNESTSSTSVGASDETESDPNVPAASDESVEETEATQEAPVNETSVSDARASAEAVLFKLRYQVIESLQQITGSFETENGSYDYARTTYRSSTNLSLRIESQGESYNEPLLVGTQLSVDG